MAAALAPRYTFAIPSLSQTIPNLPALGNLDVNRAILPNTAIDPANLVNAKSVAKNFEATHESAVNPGVTEDMVEAANLRLRAVEGAHVAAKYSPDMMTGIAAILQRLETIEASLAAVKTDITTMKTDITTMKTDITTMKTDITTMKTDFTTMKTDFTTMKTDFTTMKTDTTTMKTDIKINKAVALNQRIVSRNARNQPTFESLYKTIPGSGYQLAGAMASVAERRNLNALAEPASVGTQPPNFSADVMSYTNRDIYGLIVFYNETFGIIANDDLAARRIKLVKFLSHY